MEPGPGPGPNLLLCLSLPKQGFSALKSGNYSLTAATTQPSILELRSRSRLYQDPPCHGCLCIVYQYRHLCRCLGRVSPLVMKPNWNWKELVRSVKGNEMTFYWSHPEQSQMFGCKCMNGNAERHNSVQYVESVELATMYQATPRTESHRLQLVWVNWDKCVKG